MNDIDVYGIIYFFDAGTTVALEYMDTFWAGSDTTVYLIYRPPHSPRIPPPSPALRFHLDAQPAQPGYFLLIGK